MRAGLEQMLEDLPIAVYLCEAPSGIIRFFNRKAAELWGREPELGSEDARFCGSYRLFRPDGSPLPHSETPMAEVLRDGVPRKDEVIMERPDGSRILVQAVIVPLRDSEGRVEAVVNTFQDVTEHRGTVASLRLSEERYRAIVESQPEMIVRFLPGGALTFANEAYCRFFGLEREKITGMSYVPVVHPDDLARVEAELASMSPVNPVVRIDNRVRRSDGELRWTQWTNHAIYDLEGRLQEVQSTGRDTTDEKRAEEAAARLAAVVEGARDAIMSKTLQGVVTSWNRAAERMFGYSAEEIVGKPITTIVPEERLEEEREILDRIARGLRIEHFETERRAANGALVPVSVNISPVRDAGGRITGVSTIARDDTERRKADAELRRSLRTLEVLYRLADRVGRARSRKEVTEAAVEAILAAAKADRAAVLLLDPAGSMRFVDSRGLSKTYRDAVDGHSPWTREESNPSPILVEDVLSDESMAPLREAITAEGISALGFFPLVHQGRLLGKFMVYYDAPHRFSDHEVQLATTVAQHVGTGLTRVDSEEAIERLLERERAARREADASRTAAERANRAKDEFLAMLSHELRNPLSVIVNAIEVIAAKGPAEPVAAIQMIRRQTEHLTRLLDDLLDVARITRGWIEMEREPVTLANAVELAVEAQRHRAETKRQRLELSIPDHSITVEGDFVRLQQVVGNLVNNAIKYTPAAGSIRVSLEADGGHAVLRVRDDGVGIPADQLEEIFELFVQANPSLARTEGGLGIGLTLVKRVVELHRGEVRASSAGSGRGSEFTVRLPLAPQRAVHRAAPAKEPPGVSARILVIEDHDDGREALLSLLKQFGHRARGVGSGREGIEAAERDVPEIVLVDIGLPDLEGYQVARELRRRLGERTRLIAVTGYGQPHDRARSSEAGFDLHLVKPVEPAKLREAVEVLTRERTGA